MGQIKYNEPTSFEDMEEQGEAPVAQDPGKAVETTEATE